MLSFELRTAIARFTNEIRSLGELLSALGTLAAHYEKAHKFVIAHGNGGDQLNQAAAQLQASFVEVFKLTQTFSPSKIFLQTEMFFAAVSQFSIESESDHKAVLVELQKHASAFRHTYEEMLRFPDPVHGAELLHAASKFKAATDSTLLALDFAQFNLAPVSAAPDSGSLVLYLETGQELIDLLNKLAALQSLYSQFCRLMDVSEKEHPLKAGKVESGSLWAAIFGEPKVIDAITKTIDGVAGFLHRNFTREGKIASIPIKLDVIEQAVNLSELLKKSGIDTTQMDEQLKASGVEIAKSLTTLLADQKSVVVNDKRIPIAIPEETSQLLKFERTFGTNPTRPNLLPHRPDEGTNEVPN